MAFSFRENNTIIQNELGDKALDAWSNCSNIAEISFKSTARKSLIIMSSHLWKQTQTNAILFDVNSADIKPESFGILREIGNVLQSDKSKKIKIIGHTDADGEEDFNTDLSKKRASAVKNALVENFGIQHDRLITDGKGESEPIASNDSSSGKAQNRRTEFVVM